MEPKSLQEAILYFAKPENCREYLVARRWPDGVVCPRCESKNVLFLEKYNRWHCREKHGAPQFTLKTQTIFEDSPIPLSKWLMAMWMLCNCKNGVSSWEIHRSLKVTQKSAWFMLGRLRLALQDKASGGKLGGPDTAPAEVDETFIGGKARFMHRAKRERLSGEAGMQGGHGKAVVMGLLERGGKVPSRSIKYCAALLQRVSSVWFVKAVGVYRTSTKPCEGRQPETRNGPFLGGPPFKGFYKLPQPKGEGEKGGSSWYI